MVLLMQGFFIISCEIQLFPADNVRTSAVKITAWTIVMLLLSGMTENELKLTKTSFVEEVLGVVPLQRLVMLLLSGMTENKLKLIKTSCVEEVLGLVQL